MAGITSLKITDWQQQSFDRLHGQTGLTKSELMRRMFDYCLQEFVINQLVPTMSGSLTVAKNGEAR